MATKKAPVYILHWNQISPGERIREQPKLKGFEKKLEEEGQIAPIAYRTLEDGTKELVAGFRRWSSCALLEQKGSSIGGSLEEGHHRRLEPGKIMALDLSDLDAVETLTLELSENEDRSDFSDAERSLGYAKLKMLLEERDGRTYKVAELAGIIGESVGQVGMGLKVADAVTNKGRRDLLEKNSVKAAYQTLKSSEKLTELKNRAAAAVKRGEAAAKYDIDHDDGLAFLASLEDESVDFFNFDPPWGIAIDDMIRSRDKYEKFADDVEIWDRFSDPAIKDLYRVMKDDTWGVVWFGIQFYDYLRDALIAAGFKVDPVPSIWYKDNKTGSANDPDRHLLNVYEPFFVVKKGDPRMFKKAQSNVITFPMDRFDEREHYAQKPEGLLTEILERYTFGTMFVIDPCYGAGRIFGAAKKLGRQFAGAELSEGNREMAKNFLLR